MKKIVITGPESTGKSTLTEKLARYYNTLWVPEFAREYLTGLKRSYNLKDMEVMAKGQMSLEDKTADRNPKDAPLFIDTDLITYKIWYLHKYGAVPDWLVAEIKSRTCDLYLLCYPDLPWEADPLRENPGRGEFFLTWYESELLNYGRKYIIIKGEEQQRFELAIGAVESLLKA